MYRFGVAHTLEDVSRLTGISLGRLKRWSMANGWKTDRRKWLEYKKQKDQVQSDLKLKLLDIATKSQNPDDIYKMTLALIGAEKTDMLKQQMTHDLAARQDKKIDMKQLSQTVVDELMRRFSADPDKYNALRAIEGDLIDAMANA